MEVSPVILFKFVGSRPSVDHDIEVVRIISEKHNAFTFTFSKNEKEKEKLWGARKAAYWAGMAMRPTKKALTTDVAVPISRLAGTCLLFSEVFSNQNTFDF